jgi:hypothetical protein
MLNLRVNKDLRYIFNWTGWDAKLLQSIKPMLAFFFFKDQGQNINLGFPVGNTVLICLEA